MPVFKFYLILLQISILMNQLEFGRKLIEVRKAKGLTQEEVAESCKITVRTIQRIESGSVKPRTFTIKLISETLDFNYYDNSNTGYVLFNNRILKLNKHAIIWYVKDLFNLKTNTMKKISILSTTTLAITICFFLFNLNVFAQKSEKNKKSIAIEKNADNSINRIEVRFTNILMYDSLVHLKNDLEKYDIKINYKLLEFDDNNHLKAISCDVFFSGKKGGSFYQTLADSSSVTGFYYDYSRNAKIPYCLGGGCLQSRD